MVALAVWLVLLGVGLVLWLLWQVLVWWGGDR